VRVDKCPNCGAFLPAPAPLQTRVRCDYCHVEARTTSHIPVAPPWARVPMVAPPPSGRVRVFAALTTLVLVGAIASVVAYLRLHPTSEEPYASARVVSESGTYSKLDVMKTLAAADGQARALAGDARLVSVRAPFVRPDGQTDLSLGMGTLVVEYRSPARSVAPTDTPIGAEVRLECMVQLTWMNTYHTATRSSVGRRQCRQPTVRLPACRVVDIWERAIAAGAPRQAVATVTYEAVTAAAFGQEGFEGQTELPFYDTDQPVAGVWILVVTDGSKMVFRSDFADDCDGAPPLAPTAASAQYRAAVARLVPGGPLASFWSCPLRAGVERVHVRAHLVIPVGGMQAEAKVLEVKAAPRAPSAARQAELVKCIEDRLASTRFPAPGAATALDFEFDVKQH
jgi:hypothetical protein